MTANPPKIVKLYSMEESKARAKQMIEQSDKFVCMALLEEGAAVQVGQQTVGEIKEMLCVLGCHLAAMLPSQN